MKKNNFDLEKTITPSELDLKNNQTKSKYYKNTSKPYPTKSRKEYSQEEKNNYLDGFLEVDKTEWSKIPNGTVIRYERNDGGFRVGGIVRSIVQFGNDIKIEVAFESNPQKSFKVGINQISKIWRRNELNVVYGSNNSSDESISSQNTLNNTVNDENINENFNNSQIASITKYLNLIKQENNSLKIRINRQEDVIEQMKKIIKSNHNEIKNIKQEQVKMTEYIARTISKLSQKK